MKFDSKETEMYFYEIAKRFGIMHVNMDKDAVMTMNDVNLMVKSLRKANEDKEKRTGC